MPSVSIIIVNWNGREHLDACLPALASQTRQADEVIVVDNGSTDGSTEHVRQRHPGVRVVQLDSNLGFTGGNLAGFQAAMGRYIVLLNNDTAPNPDWLERLVKCADRYPEVGMIASHLTDWDARKTDTAGDGCSVTGRGFKRHRDKPLTDRVDSGYAFAACAGAALYKREMLADVGFFDARFFMNGEDTDLALRAQLRGWKCYFCADAFVRHRVGGSQGVNSELSVYYSARNHLMSYAKCMPLRLILVYAPFFLAETIKLWATFAAKRRGAAYARGILAGLVYSPSLLGERGRIRRGRRISVAELEKLLSWPRPLNRFRQRMRGCDKRLEE